MDTNYETYTAHKQGIPLLKTDVPAGAIFDLGHPVQTATGLNGFMMEVNAAKTIGVVDIMPGQIYHAAVVLATAASVGTDVFFDPSDGSITNDGTGLIKFGNVVRTSETEVFPTGATGTVRLGIQLVN